MTKISAASGKHRDSITILVTSAGNLATKRFVMTADGIYKESYHAGYLFGVMKPREVYNIQGLSLVLEALEPLANALVIRGVPKDSCEITKHVRRTKENFASPKQGHHWILLDFDKIQLPKHLSLQHNLVEVCEYLISLLPAEFHGASYHWQLSSSAGMGDPGKVSMHLWFWLNQPVSDVNLKKWGNAVNKERGIKLIDTALFNDVQIHYTAAPLFLGMPNPFVERSGLIEKQRHEVALVLPPSAAVSQRSLPSRRRKIGRSKKFSGSSRENLGQVIETLVRAGHYLAPLNIDGAHRIVCPWVSEHTDEDRSGTVYFAPNDQNNWRGGFKCHHGHCQDRNIVNLTHFLSRLHELNKD